MSEKDFTTLDLCRMLGSVVFLERFLERMNSKRQDELKIRLIIDKWDSFFESQIDTGDGNITCELISSHCGIEYVRDVIADYADILLSYSEVERLRDVAGFLAYDVVRIIENRIASKEKRVRLIIDHPKSVFDCKIGDDRIITPVFNPDNRNKIISYPGPHIKTANKRTM
jgi:hypothetical protein